jgi:hypothetical protein
MAFFLFILANAVLFIRPSELFPELQAVSIYLPLITLCLFSAIPDVLACLTVRSLDRQPITLCVLGLQVAVVLPHVAAMDLVGAWEAGLVFFRVLSYFLLFVSLVTTAQRLRRFMAWLLTFILVLAALPVLQYHEFIHVANVSKVIDFEADSITGQLRPVDRIHASGIFQDPNDLSVMLAAMTPLALFALTDRKSGWRKILWAAEIVLFGYAIYRTQSRGGMLALLGGLGAFTWARFGVRRLAAFGILVLPFVLLLGGRQTDFSTQGGTGQARVQIWSDWLSDFAGNPILGSGDTLDKEPADQPLDQQQKRAAHNSFLQAFADIGLIGGSLFLGAFCLAFWTLLSYRSGRTFIVDPELRRLQPYLVGMVAAYGLGMMSLSLSYLIPTFAILALTQVFARMVTCWPPVPEIRFFDGRVAGRLALASVTFLLGLYGFVRLFVNWT